MSDVNLKFKNSLTLPTVLVVIIWIVHLLKYFLGLDLRFLAMHPLHSDGLLGIFTSPFVHGDFYHLFNNSFPLFVSTGIILYFFPKIAKKSLLLIYVLTGIVIWLFARQVYHIGASGIVYGFVSFIFWTGVFRRNMKSVVLSLIIIILYSGMLVGLVPNPEENISWESHLIGLIIGAIIAFTYRDELEPDELAALEYKWSEEEESQKSYFLPRDIFEKTKQERLKEEENAQNQGWNTDHTLW